MRGYVRQTLLLTLLTLALVLSACGAAAPAAPTTVASEPTTAAAPAATSEMAEPTAQTEAEPTTEAEPADDAEPATGGLPEVDPAMVEGDIIVAGSSTVFPLAERIAEYFRDEGYGGDLTIDSVGTGAGFERFCVSAETDIAAASRAIKDEEIASCEENGRTPVEFRVGTDALAVVMSAENDFAEDLTLEQLAAIFSGEAKTWADVDPSYPAEEIELFSPGTDSGTFDYFVEVVFEDDKEPLLSANPQLSEDDNVLVQGVEGSPYAIGYFGYAYYQENEEGLKLLSIDGVEPNEETTESGDYSLSRPLYLYSSADVIAEKPQVGDFLNYFLTIVNEEILDVGYFPATEESLNEARQNLAGVIGE